METLTFEQLKNLPKGCPRRSLFYLNKIGGKLQYYLTKKKYINQLILNYLDKRFNLKQNLQVYDPNNEFNERLQRENADEILANLDGLINKYAIKILSLKTALEFNNFEIDEKNSTFKFEVDAIGTFNGVYTIFKITPLSRFKREFAYELILAKMGLAPEKTKLIVLKLGKGEIREIKKNGDINKNGSPSKRKGALGNWTILLNEAKNFLKEAYGIYFMIQEQPQSFNKPNFGSCGTCQYHNYEVEFEREKIICSG